MTARAWVDGEPDAAVSPFDVGFLHGDAVFETVRACGGAPIDLDAHLDRLADAAAAIELVLPAAPALAAALAPALADPGDRRLRLIVTRGHGAGPTVVVTAEPRSAPPPTAVVAVVDVPLTDPRALDSAHKTGSYLPNLRAARAARALGADEALRRDRAGLVATGATSNLLAIVDGRIAAPIGAGVRAGVTRARVLALAAAQGLAADARALTDDELVAADALLITSSIRGVVAVHEMVGEVRAAWSAPHPIARALIAAYDEYVAHVATCAAG